MTTYIAEYSNAGASTGECSIKAVTYQMKISKIEPVAASASYISIYRYSGATLTGGTTVTPASFREGAAASAAQAKRGATTSGTSTLISTYANAAGAFQPPSDLIMVAGSAIRVIATQVPDGGGAVIGLLTVAIYFEELHLARSL